MILQISILYVDVGNLRFISCSICFFFVLFCSLSFLVCFCIFLYLNVIIANKKKYIKINLKKIVSGFIVVQFIVLQWENHGGWSPMLFVQILILYVLWNLFYRYFLCPLGPC